MLMVRTNQLVNGMLAVKEMATGQVEADLQIVRCQHLPGDDRSLQPSVLAARTE